MNILVVSPHLDDETIGAGGAICRYIAEGHQIYWLNISNTKEEYGFARSVVELREQQRQKVIETYPFSGAFDLKLRPAALKEYPDNDIIPQIDSVIKQVRPEMLILPYEHDIHSDHGVVFRWCLPFTKSFRYPYIKKVLIMETLSETDFSAPEYSFQANYIVDVSNYMEKKLAILKLYEQELGMHPFPRSESNILALAHLRGAVAGVTYAEGFKLFRWIDK